MQRASTSENSSFNVVLLKYFWRTRVRPEHSKRICFTVKDTCSDHRQADSLLTRDMSESLEVSNSESSDDCFITTVQRCTLFFPNTGFTLKSLFVGVLFQVSCHSSIQSFEIYGKKLSAGILFRVMADKMPAGAAISAISFPFIPLLSDDEGRMCRTDALILSVAH